MRPPAQTVGDAGEQALLQRLRARIPAAPDVVRGPGDDAALVRTGPLSALTTDALVEGVHFRREWSTPRRIGRKALAVNLSDVAAMAARPRFATISLCLPGTLELSWLDGLYDGLLERAAEAGVALVGGNLSAIAGPIVIDVAVLGEVAGPPLLRRGAAAGDRVVVTGPLGQAWLGLALLAAGLRLGDDGVLALPASLPRPTPAEERTLRECLRAQLDPEPPLAFAAGLGAIPEVHAGIDLSDGLSGDLLSLCAESDLAAELEAGAVPVAATGEGLERWGASAPLEAALHGGEDYQLLLAVAPEGLGALDERAREHGVAVTVIGRFVEGAAAVWLQGEGGREPLTPRSHEHFRTRGGSGREA